MALSAHREIHESWISRKGDRCLLAFSMPSFPSDIDDGERKRRDGGWRMESADLQSGRYLQVKSSRTAENDYVRRIVRIIRRIEGIRFTLLSRLDMTLSRDQISRPLIRKRIAHSETRSGTPWVRNYVIFFRRLSPLMVFLWCPRNRKIIDTLLLRTEPLSFFIPVLKMTVV